MENGEQATREEEALSQGHTHAHMDAADDSIPFLSLNREYRGAKVMLIR